MNVLWRKPKLGSVAKVKDQDPNQYGLASLDPINILLLILFAYRSI